MRLKTKVSCFVLLCLSLLSKTTLIYATEAWSFELAPRYWLSTGTYQLNLMGTNALVSRLTTENWTGNSAEVFGKLQHSSGVFAKGYIGGGSLSDGQFIDEDFLPGITPYSRTQSDLHHDGLKYLSLDLGYDLIQYDRFKLEGFVGYHYWNQTYHVFGAQQIASNPDILPNNPPVYGGAPDSMNVINLALNWNALRLGINGSLAFSNFTIDSDVAYTRSNLSAYDFHNLRPDIRGDFEDGSGNGVQLDTLFHWQSTPQLRLGIGGRWWYVLTNGLAHFEQTYASGQPQPIKVIQSTYGLLLQANYQFNDSKPLIDKETPVNSAWNGLYLGPNIGYGTHPAIIYNNVISASAQSLQNLYNTPPYSLNVSNEGFLAGGQVGYQSMFEHILWGVEADLDYSAIAGSNAMTPNDIPVTTTVRSDINWLGTLRGRLGKVATKDTMVYLTAGLAYGNASLAFAQQQPGVNCPYSIICVDHTETQLLAGYTAGAGIEYAITSRATMKLEYLFVALGNITANPAGTSFDGPINVQAFSQLNSNIVRIGGNFRV